jgi:tight adherence protein B
MLFYDSLWGMLCIIAVFPLVLWMEKSRQESHHQRRLNLEFKDYLYAVGGTMAAGNSPERAFLLALEEVKELYGDESLLAESLSVMEKRLGVQEPLEQILRDFAADARNEDIQNFVEIFCYAKRSGGDFLHIIQTTVSRICDKIEVSEEIHTVMAEKALEQKVMCVVPFGVLEFFRVSSPEFIGKLYGNLLGIVIMTVALLLYGAAFFLGARIVKIEV